MDDDPWRDGALAAVLATPDLTWKCRLLAELARSWRAAGWPEAAIRERLEQEGDGRAALIGHQVEVLPAAGPWSLGRHGRLMAVSGDVAAVLLSTGQQVDVARDRVIPLLECVERRERRLRRQTMTEEPSTRPDDYSSEWTTTGGLP